MHFGGGAGAGGMRFGGANAGFRGAQANIGAARVAGTSGAPFAGGGTRFGGGNPGLRGAQANIGTARVAGTSGATFVGRGGGQFAQNGYRGGFRGDHDRRFGRGLGFAAGLAAGSALGYGYGYDPYYYGDDYAYDDDYYDVGYPAYSGVAVSSAADPAYCAQRYRSYDPATGTYLGYDGLRHPCG
jgi:hypothetical protein